MALGRPRLDPEVKQQRCTESLQCYAANKYSRNTDKLHEQARVRMQWHRAAIADSHTSTKLWYAERGAEASERYCRRKHEQEWDKYRAENIVKKGAQKKEVEKLRKKHFPAAAAHSPSAPRQQTQSGAVVICFLNMKAARQKRRITTTRRKPQKQPPHSFGVSRHCHTVLSVTARGAQAALACALLRLTGSSTKMDTSSQYARHVVGRTAQAADAFAQRAQF
ncbi:hypothetical protein B0H14DRAFT_2593610 [Mycena olivaceomarginata]|nr:hypothetical protein B0H14DRAFT_2593610 [Mycena olivaceomarginata]